MKVLILLEYQKMYLSHNLRYWDIVNELWKSVSQQVDHESFVGLPHLFLSKKKYFKKKLNKDQIYFLFLVSFTHRIFCFQINISQKKSKNQLNSDVRHIKFLYFFGWFSHQFSLIIALCFSFLSLYMIEKFQLKL